MKSVSISKKKQSAKKIDWELVGQFEESLEDLKKGRFTID